mmetsp:Transcript_12923/g.35094  ORF Transcript_12923/g.35094 Transcript_12923/m.35094 type:complete len:230 (+) Transcript_12923:44-733(+)
MVSLGAPPALAARLAQGLGCRHFGAFRAPPEMLRAAVASKPWPPWLQREMRSNWAGETGAVAIYRGCQAALPRVQCAQARAALEAFAAEHVEAEEAHLAAVAAVVAAPSERSWMPATSFGWGLGFASTAGRGARGMYITTHAVESFVEEHYGDQIRQLSSELQEGALSPKEAYSELLALLQGACADEVLHKEEAAARAVHELKYTAVDKLHFALVYWGSRVGAAVAKRI